MENLRIFNTQEEYEAWKDSDDYVVPNACKVNGEMIYNDFPEPFWVEALEDLIFTYSYKNGDQDFIYGCYSFDKINWTLMSRNVPVRTGQKVYIINTVRDIGLMQLGISGRYNAGGNLLSLEYGLDYLEHTESKTSSPVTLFVNTKIVNAKDLILPDVSYWVCNALFRNCELLQTPPKFPKTYTEIVGTNLMFEGCTSLTNAPTIPNVKLKQGSDIRWTNMFANCTSLSYIKALFTWNFDGFRTINWVSNVSPTGTFIANSKRTDFTRGTNGIPEGWDLYLYDEDNDRYVVRFKVNNIPYEFYTDEPRDITWGEFNASEQNTNGFKNVLESTTPCVKLGTDYVLLNGERASGNIILHANYTIGQPTETAEE